MKRSSILATLLALALAPAVPAIPSSCFAAKEYGAVGDGIALDSNAIQLAIDACAAAGGGTVYLAPGTYCCGSIHLRSHVTLNLDNGATLLASESDADFDPCETLDFKNDSDGETSFFHFSLLWGEDIDHVAITGQGKIDSNRKKRGGPKTIALKRCREIAIQDITILNSGNYTISMLGTDNVNIDGVKIAGTYCDGIDPDCCRNVRISNCDIESWDDAIVPKTSFSLGYRRSTEYITVTNCILRTVCNAFKLGTESGGDFKHITVSNCVVAQFESKLASKTTGPPTSGIVLISADGAAIENVTIDNIVMDGVQYPVFLRLGNRGRDLETPVPGTMRQVIVSNITASNALAGVIVIGHPGSPIENVTLSHVKITCRGGGDQRTPEMDIPAAMLKYPSADKFDGLRTYGVYVRHVNGLRLEDFQLNLVHEDTRPALLAHDAENLSIDSFQAPAVAGASALLSFEGVHHATVRDCDPKDTLNAFLQFRGPGSGAIVLLNNDFTRVGNATIIEDSTPPEGLRIENNLYKK